MQQFSKTYAKTSGEAPWTSYVSRAVFALHLVQPMNVELGTIGLCSFMLREDPEQHVRPTQKYIYLQSKTMLMEFQQSVIWLYSTACETDCGTAAPPFNSTATIRSTSSAFSPTPQLLLMPAGHIPFSSTAQDYRIKIIFGSLRLIPGQNA